MRKTTRGALALSALGLAALSACGPTPGAKAPAAPRGPMFDAFAVAYGKPAPYQSLDESGDTVVYTPQKLIEVAPGVVALISRSDLPSRCKACAGAIDIHYLKQGPDGFHRLGAWPGFGGHGSYGAPLPWVLRTDLDDGPTLVTQDDEKDTICTATKQELITLTPTAPVKVATVITATAYAPAPGDKTGDHVSGKIVPIAKGKSFAVVLTGTASVRQVFKREGQVFVTHDVGATGC